MRSILRHLKVLPTRLLDFPRSIEIEKSPDKKLRQVFTGASALAAGGGKTSNRLPCSFPKMRRVHSSHGVRVGVCPGVRLEQWLRWFSLTFVVLSGGGMHSTLFYAPDTHFAPGSLEMAVGFYIYIFGSRICPNCMCSQLSLVLYSFFVFCSLRRGVSKCKLCSTAAKGPGPSLSQKKKISHLSLSAEKFSKNCNDSQGKSQDIPLVTRFSSICDSFFSWLFNPGPHFKNEFAITYHFEKQTQTGLKRI